MSARKRNPGRFGVITGLLLAAVLAAACGPSKSAGSAPTTTTLLRASGTSTNPAQPTSLRAPKTSAAQDGQYLLDVTEADPALTAYVREQGNIAMHALLTDGSAFCAFLNRGGGIDNAMVSVAIGARGLESQTHLPLSVTTFNTMEAVALVALCPSELKLAPTSDQVKVRDLATALARHSG
ncbi:MAG: hypothetical protein ACLPUG_03995 [Acidimicrobiales bacterium]